MKQVRLFILMALLISQLLVLPCFCKDVQTGWKTVRVDGMNFSVTIPETFAVSVNSGKKEKNQICFLAEDASSQMMIRTSVFTDYLHTSDEDILAYTKTNLQIFQNLNSVTYSEPELYRSPTNKYAKLNFSLKENHTTAVGTQYMTVVNDTMYSIYLYDKKAKSLNDFTSEYILQATQIVNSIAFRQDFPYVSQRVIFELGIAAGWLGAFIIIIVSQYFHKKEQKL